MPRELLLFVPRPQSHKLFCAGGLSASQSPGDFVDCSKMENFTAGSPQFPDCLENGLQIPLKDSSARLYANGLLATGTGFDTLKNGVSTDSAGVWASTGIRRFWRSLQAQGWCGASGDPCYPTSHRMVSGLDMQ